MWPTIAATPAAAGAAGSSEMWRASVTLNAPFAISSKRDQNAGREPRHAQDVGGAEVAAADTTHVVDAPHAPDQQRKRNRSDGVGHEDDNRHW